MKLFVAPLFVLASLATAQTPANPQTIQSPRISLDARGEDVREVLATLFAQAKRPYALSNEIKGTMYIVIDQLPYEKALSIVLSQAGLKANEKDGTILVSALPKTPATTPAPVTSTPTPQPTPAPRKPSETKPSAAPFEQKLLNKRVTTRMTKTPIEDVFAALSKQSGADIQMEPNVPNYRVDAFLINTSLRYAVEKICKATNLHYTLDPGNRIRIGKM